MFDTDFEATVVLALLPDEDFFVILLADLVGAFFTVAFFTAAFFTAAFFTAVLPATGELGARDAAVREPVDVRETVAARTRIACPATTLSRRNPFRRLS